MRTLSLLLVVLAVVLVTHRDSSGATERLAAARTATCPHVNPGGATHSAVPGARKQLVPKRFQSILLCRYRSTYLIRSVRLSPDKAEHLADLFDALQPLTHRQREAFYSCFFAEPQPVLALVTYPTGAPLSVFVPIGCGIGSTNGVIERGDPQARRAQLYATLERETGERVYTG